jgi:hypothetical protein
MTVRQKVRVVASAVRRGLKLPLNDKIMSHMKLYPHEKDAVASQFTGAMADVFFQHKGRIINKWVHYLEIYDRHFAAYRYTPVKMLEIGVFKGGSLEMWREYFGPTATIFGIDINPACADYATPPNQVRIGSQDDAAFLEKVILEMGMPDIILDDGSHVGKHQRKSFDVLFPRLKPGGLYVIEDLSTSYWPRYGGGYKREGTAIGHIKEMIDDMHAWYHNKPVSTPGKTEIGAIHMYDQIAVIEKRHREQPKHIEVG